MQRAVRSIVPVLISSFVLPFFAAAYAEPAEDRPAVERQIRRAIEEWMAAANRGDAEGKKKIWAAGVQGWFPSAAEFKRVAAFDGTVDDKAVRSSYTVTINEVIVSRDLAVVRDTWEEAVHARDGRSAHRIIQSFEVWQPQADGEWKISRWISAPGPWQHPKT